MTREHVRASSSPVFRDRGSSTEQSSVGVHRVTKAPSEEAPTAGSIHLSKTRRVQVRRNEPDGEGASDGR
jgi:hypothetical protein